MNTATSLDEAPAVVAEPPPARPPDAPESSSPPTTWTDRLLRGQARASPGSDAKVSRALAGSAWSEEGRRLLLALSLAALFGVALGLRRGGLALLLGALGAPAGIVAVSAVAVPAFAIVLALANAPIDAMALARATSRAAAKAGLLLAGLAPAAAMFVVSVEDAITVTIVGFGGLLVAGIVASGSFARELGSLLGGAPAKTRTAMGVAMPLFLLFAAALSARVWWLAFPQLVEALWTSHY